MLRTIEIKQSVFADNNREADSLRAELKGKGLFLLNLMSSPGSGKTTTLVRTIEALRDELRIGIMEADIDSDVDAHTVQNAGAKAVQDSIRPLRNVFKFGNPNTVVKKATKYLGYNVGECRAPFNQLSAAGMAALKKALDEDKEKGMK